MAATLKGRQAAERVVLRSFNALLATDEGRAPFAERMAQLREERGASQYTCADALGIDQPTYRAMEMGEVRFRRRDLVTLATMYFPRSTADRALQLAFGNLGAV